MSDEKFKDQSTYVVAFLASVIGLSAFKQELLDQHVSIFGWWPSLFTLLLPVVLLLFFAAYLGALALAVDILNITKWPIKGFLMYTSVSVITVALAGPIGVGILILLTWIGHLLPSLPGLPNLPSFSDGVVNVLSISASSSVAMVVVVTSYITARLFRDQEMRSRAVTAIAEAKSMEMTLKTSKNKVSDVEFITNYELLRQFAKDYLRTTGYGVRDNSLHNFVKVLVEKGVFTTDDLRKSRQIAVARNEFFRHGEISDTKLVNCPSYLQELYEKLKAAYLELTVEKADKPKPRSRG